MQETFFLKNSFMKKWHEIFSRAFLTTTTKRALDLLSARKNFHVLGKLYHHQLTSLSASLPLLYYKLNTIAAFLDEEKKNTK